MDKCAPEEIEVKDREIEADACAPTSFDPIAQPAAAPDLHPFQNHAGETAPEVIGPFIQGHYTADHNGLFIDEVDKNGGVQRIRLADEIYVVGRARTEKKRDWAYYIGFYDGDGDPQFTLLWGADAQDGSAWWSKLGGRGFTLAPGAKVKRLVAEYITGYAGSARFIIARSVGWNTSTDQFILPSGASTGKDSDSTLFVPAGAGEPIEAAKLPCTIDDWKTGVAGLCKGNSRLVLGLCAAFAAPLLKPLGHANFALNIFGASSVGKSTALNVAASVCGHPDDYGARWNATPAGLEQFLPRHNDCLVCLDEIGEATETLLDAAPYAISAGKGKLKSNKSQTLQESASWRTVVFSTGELTLDQALARRDRRMQAGQAVRCIDLPADAGAGIGLFEKLNDLETPRHLADALNDKTRTYYGIALAEFIDKLVIAGKLADVVARAPQELANIATTLYPPKASGQVRRVAKNFALLQFAGRLACEFEILPFLPGEIDVAIASCFQSWLDHRGTVNELEPEEGMRQVRSFCEAHGRSRFEVWGSDPSLNHVRDRVGFVRTEGKDAGFYVFPDAFKNIVCKGLDHRRVARELMQRGLLLANRNGEPSKIVNVPGYGSKRLYHLSIDIIGMDGDDEAWPSPRDNQ